MNRLVLFFLVVCVFLFSRCGQDPPEEGQIPMSNISTITFGTGWNSNNSTVSDTGRIFLDSTDVVYYEIKFDSLLVNWHMLKHVWMRGSNTLLSSVTLIPAGSKRICGEFRKYDGDTLGLGTYRISVYYFDMDYIETTYNSGVDTTFVIQ